MAQWTEASDEVKTFERENKTEKVIIDYFPDNRKIWSFYKTDRKGEKPIAVFEQYFDMDFFKR